MHESVSFESVDTAEADYQTDSLDNDPYETDDSKSDSYSSESKKAETDKKNGEDKKSEDKESDKSGDKEANPEWDDSALFNLVSENQDVLVKDGDAVKTVSEFMLSHPGPWNAENEPNLISYVHQLLANRVTETETQNDHGDTVEKEKSTDAIEADKENDVKANDKEAQADSIKVDSKEQPKADTVNTEQPETNTNVAKKPPEPKASHTPEPEVTIDLTQNDSTKSAQDRPEVKDALPDSARSSVNTVKDADPSSSETMAEAANEPGNSAGESIMDKIDQEPALVHESTPGRVVETEPIADLRVEAKQPVPIPKTSDINTQPAQAVEAEPAADNSGFADDSEPETIVLSEMVDEPEVPELADVEFEGAVIADDAPEHADMLAGDGFLLETNDLVEFAEEEVLVLDHTEFDDSISEPNLDVEEETVVVELEEEVELQSQPEIVDLEEFADLDSYIVEENFASDLVEKVQSIEPEAIEAVSEIEQVVPEIEVNDNNNIAKAEIPDQVEEKIIELIEYAEVDYPPELTEKLTDLVRKWHAGDEVQKMRIEREIGELIQDPGTREDIINILVGINNDKEPLELIRALGGYAYASAHSFALVA